jgi:hypothetical protein
MLDELAELDGLTARAVEALSRDEGTTPPVLRLLLRRYAMTGRSDLEAVLGPGLAQALEIGLAEADEDGSAWLELFAEAGSLSGDERVRDAAAGLAARIAAAVAASEARTVASAMQAIHACLRAADLFAGGEAAASLVVQSVDALERIIGPNYQPGNGMPHLAGGQSPPRGRTPGTLSDQMQTASALLEAHAWTGRLPYTMLAEELVQFARRSCWPDADGPLNREPERFIAACEAVTVLCRLSAIHADPAYQQAAVVAAEGDYVGDAAALLHGLVDASRRHDISVAAHFGLAICEWLSLER